MSKRGVHFAALGYEPLRMKPVHFARGFFLSITGRAYDLELLNKTAVISHREGLKGEYDTKLLIERLVNEKKVEPSINEEALKRLRVHVNGVANNDDAMYGAFDPYSPPFGNDYTTSSGLLLSSQRLRDGLAGFFVYQVLEKSAKGQEVLAFARKSVNENSTPIEMFLGPLLDADDKYIDYANQYNNDSTTSKEKLKSVSDLMLDQTEALSNLCLNLEGRVSHQSKIRCLIICLSAWLFMYIQKITEARLSTPVLLMDFTGGGNHRVRRASQNSYSRQREHFYGSYRYLREHGLLDYDEKDFTEVQKNPKFLEQHFSDLAVRIGFAQPRAVQISSKHFELQPDTARVLVLSVTGDTIENFSDVARKLRNIWGVCVGGCDDDESILRNSGHLGLDLDEDLEPNSLAFIGLLKRLNLAVEPSDGLVLIVTNPEESI